MSMRVGQDVKSSDYSNITQNGSCKGVSGKTSLKSNNSLISGMSAFSNYNKASIKFGLGFKNNNAVLTSAKKLGEDLLELKDIQLKLDLHTIKTVIASRLSDKTIKVLDSSASETKKEYFNTLLKYKLYRDEGKLQQVTKLKNIELYLPVNKGEASVDSAVYLFSKLKLIVDNPTKFNEQDKLRTSLENSREGDILTPLINGFRQSSYSTVERSSDDVKKIFGKYLKEEYTADQKKAICKVFIFESESEKLARSAANNFITDTDKQNQNQVVIKNYMHTQEFFEKELEIL